MPNRSEQPLNLNGTPDSIREAISFVDSLRLTAEHLL